MIFGTALEFIKMGKAVRRKGGDIITARKVKIGEEMHFHLFASETYKGDVYMWTPTNADIFAEDYELVD